MTGSSLTKLRHDFHRELCDTLLVLDEKGIASNADKSQRASIEIARSIAQALGAPIGGKLAGQTAGLSFERAVEHFVAAAVAELGLIRPGEWTVECINSRADLIIARYEQYSHLREVKRIANENPDLAVFVGNDYNVASDVVMSRKPLSDSDISLSGLKIDDVSGTRSPLRARNNALPILHASISCKWTMRSDRAQKLSI